MIVRLQPGPLRSLNQALNIITLGIMFLTNKQQKTLETALSSAGARSS